MAVGFGRTYADAEFISDHFGQLALENPLQHFAFTRREQGHALADHAVTGLQFRTFAVNAQPVLNSLQEVLRGKRLLEKIKRPAAHGAHHRLNLGITGNEDNR